MPAASQPYIRKIDPPQRDGECDNYEFVRANSRSEMMRAVGAKAVASAELAVPPTLAAGDWSVYRGISEGETSDEDLCGSDSDIDD